MDVRKNQRTLTADEKSRFVHALLALKNEVPSQMGLAGRYDDYVQIHMESMMVDPGWAHRVPAFCPWHRAFIRRLELDLQKVDPTVCLPYWDWTQDSSPDPTVPGSPWTGDFMGGDGDSAGGKVTSGAFAYDAGNWVQKVTDNGIDYLSRQFGVQAPLPTPNELAAALTEVPYDAAQWGPGDKPSFRDRLEGWHGLGSLHNAVHLWMGGSMLEATSPNDPIFFLHHCNVDRLWAEWQVKHPDQGYHPSGQGADTGPRGSNLNDPMQPWAGTDPTVTPKSVLDHQSLGYRYDTEGPPVPGPVRVTEAPHRPKEIPTWKFQPTTGQGMGHMLMQQPMFDLSPEDKAAGKGKK